MPEKQTVATAVDNSLMPDMKFGKKSFISVCLILIGIIVLVTILTHIIPAGIYDAGADGKFIEGSYHQIESETRLEWWQVLYSPVSALLFAQGNDTIIMVCVLLLVLGGSFLVMEKTGGLIALVRILLDKFSKRRRTLVWVVTFFMMLLAASFGLQEELLILFPIFLVLSKAMGWSNRTAISLILITTGVGWTTALTNPISIGTASGLAGTQVSDGILYRLVIFVFYFVFTSLYLVRQTKKDEKAAANVDSGKNLYEEQLSMANLSESERKEIVKKAKMFGFLFGGVFVIMLITSFVQAISGYAMLFMGAAFLLGTFGLGFYLLGVKPTLKAFLKGMLNISPAIFIIILAFSVKYIAERANILHTIFYSIYTVLTAQSPYVSVLLIFLMVLTIEFFIPGVTGKAILIIPLLTLLPIDGLSKNLIILAFLFGDGFTNVFFPTCATLMVGLSLAKVSFVDWVKHTALLQMTLALIACGFLVLGVAIGY